MLLVFVLYLYNWCFYTFIAIHFLDYEQPIIFLWDSRAGKHASTRKSRLQRGDATQEKEKK